jgi:hypothetical protein
MTPRNRRSYRQLLAALLLAGGTSAIALPLLAQSNIGDQIRNTFTGTFQDNNNQEFTATSNEVVLVVSEVAGLTVQAQAPSQVNPNAGDTIFVDFLITNVGNDPTQVFIPGQVTIANPPGQTGSGSYTPGTPQLVEFNGAALPTPINLPTNGESSGNLPNIPNNGALNAGQTLRVRVPLTVSASALRNDSVQISLGNTGATANQQNITYTNDANSVYTINIPDGGAPGEAAGVIPANGQREAMATSQAITVGARLQSFGTILLARDYNNANTPGVISDDRITYNLAARVEPTVPAGVTDIVPAPLCQTQINLDGTPVNRILIADAIPTGTILSSANPIAATNGAWQVVYTTSPLSILPNAANWTINRPPSDQITRVGFILDACIPTTQTVSGFSFVVEPQPNFPGGSIANIAQLFGQTLVGAPVPNTPTQIIYDESGDQDPNNGLGANNPDTSSGGAAENNGGIVARAADTALDGIDPGQGTSSIATDTNQGVNTGATAGSKLAGGETVLQNLAPAPSNGPQDQPGAIGPRSTDDDFTNIILAPPAAIPANQRLDDAQTPPVTFTNTVRSFSNSNQDIFLLPQPPTPRDRLPDGTRVTITNPANGQSATYTYTAANGFTFVSGIGGTSATQPVVMSLTPAANTGNYTVTVDLPSAEQIQEYPIPILAYIDQGTPGYDINDPGNVTIDRIYTGFIRVLKEARLLAEDGTTEIIPFTSDTARLSQEAQTDRIIEYRLTYTNISITQGNGTNNIVLPATNFTIIDDGNATPNNWFSTTLDPNFPTQPNGSAISSSGTLNVTVNNNDIQVYNLQVGTLNPGDSGTLTFRRRIRKL